MQTALVISDKVRNYANLFPVARPGIEIKVIAFEGPKNQLDFDFNSDGIWLGSKGS